MSDIQLPGIRLYYEEHGTGAPILLSHGTGSDAGASGAAIEDLAHVGRVIAYDRRGFTRSERPEPYNRVTPVEHAHDAASLLEALDATPAIVIGRSYGGNVALDLALRYPERVRARVLLEGGGEALSPEVGAFIEELIEQIRATVAERGPEAAGEALWRAVLGDADYEDLPEGMTSRVEANGPAIVAEIEGFFDAQPGPEELGRIACPVLVISAMTSPSAFQRCNESLVAALPNGRLATVAGGHMITPAEPEVVTFIRDVLAAA